MRRMLLVLVGAAMLVAVVAVGVDPVEGALPPITTTSITLPTTTTTVPPTTTTTIAPVRNGEALGVQYAAVADQTSGPRCDWGPPCQELDIWYWSDATTRRRPTILFIHQGAWAGGGRWSWGYPSYAPSPKPEWATLLANAGYVTATMSYDLNQGRRNSQQPADVAHAVSWLKANADVYGIDPSRIALYGSSAGAHLALLHAMRYGSTGPLGVKAMVEYSGPTDLTALATSFGCATAPCYKDPINQREGNFAGHEDPRVAGWAVQGYAAHAGDRFPNGLQKHCLVDNSGSLDHPACPQTYIDGSPITYVAAGRALPKMLLVHSPGDFVVPYDQLRSFTTALSLAGYGESTFQVIEPRACHGHGSDPTSECTRVEVFWTGNKSIGENKTVWTHAERWLNRVL